MITLEDVIKKEEVKAFIEGAQKQLKALGYTEHSYRHIGIVSKRTGEILEKLEYDEKTIELGKIAGYLHDIGNVVNRVDHAHSGAILAYNILKEMKMPLEDITEIVTAIGNHDEKTGTAVSAISAALILADKSDVHRNRVENTNMSNFDIHDRVNYAVTDSKLEINEKERKIDRVNYAVTDSKLEINEKERKIVLKLTIDTQICPVLDYFQIFMDRTMMSKYAAKYLQVWYELVINGTKLL